MSFIDSFLNGHPLKYIGKGEYLLGGEGKTAFLIFPGSGQNALSCYDLVNEFENKYKTITFSYSGFYNLESFFNFVNKVLEKETVNNIILYGLSMGGFIAQHYVLRFPDKVQRLILSHTGTTKSKTIINKVAIPGKILHFFLPIIPVSLFKKLLMKFAGKTQSGKDNIKQLWADYSTKENTERRQESYIRLGWNWLSGEYLETVYRLGIEMEKIEKSQFKPDLLGSWKGKVLIIRTDNDPLAQDDGVFKVYYPNAKVFTFHDTGHLTPFIQFEKMVRIIRNFIS